jgi:cardiolipin synthase (CMP-forming)
MGLADRQGEDRILTVPNGLTLVRLLCIPIFVWLLARPDRSGWYPAALLLGVLGLTDWVDGYVARHFHQVSAIGKVLDPLADRLLLAVAAVSIIVVGALPGWVAVGVLSREILVAAGFLIVAALGGRRIDVQWAGKAGTFGLMAALPLFLIGHAPDDWHGIALTLAYLLVIPALAFAWYAAITYIPQARAAIAEGRRQHEEASA